MIKYRKVEIYCFEINIKERVDMNFINKKGIIIVLIAFIICMTVVGCSDNSEETPSEPVQEPEETASEPAQEPEEVVQYVDNETINSFLIAFTEATGKEMTDIDNSSRKYKATAKYDGFWIVIEDLQEEFRVRIEQTSDTASVGMPGMKEAFFGIVKAMDDSINDEEIYSWIFIF